MLLRRNPKLVYHLFHFDVSNKKTHTLDFHKIFEHDQLTGVGMTPLDTTFI